MRDWPFSIGDCGAIEYVAQRWIVRAEHVGKMLVTALHGTNERIAPAQVDVIVDDHEVAGRKRFANSSGRVRNEQHSHTERGRDARRESSSCRGMTLVHVEPAAERNDGLAGACAGNHAASVPFNRCGPKARDVVVRQPAAAFPSLDHRTKAGAKDQRSDRWCLELETRMDFSSRSRGVRGAQFVHSVPEADLARTVR